MKKKYKILTQYIKDISGETPDVETYLFVKDNISKYHLSIDISSKPLKNRLIEINTALKFEDKDGNAKKSFFEIIYATIINVDKELNEKNDLQKIILCDVQILTYPKIEKALLDLIHNSGFPGVKFEKKIDFEKLYSEKFN
tara:strand:+ start:2466 stop:2888 length:423 start_codon:yes stop_codon:yes gene_type:complete